MSRRVILSFGLSTQLLLGTAAYAQPEGAVAPAVTGSDGLLAREPQTPEEQFDAAVTMLQLSRPELARQYLTVLLAANPDDATLFAIRDKHGTATFVQMSRLEALQPDSIELLDRLTAAAQNQLDDPAFQDSLVQGLTGMLRQRQTSIDTMRALGDGAAPLIIRRLAAGATPAEETQLMEALLRLGPTVAAPLEACLLSPNEHLRAIAADLLGHLEAKSAVLPLSAVAFDPHSSPALVETAKRALARIQFGGPQYAHQVTNLRLAERLKSEATACLGQRTSFATGDDGLVPLWTWSEGAGTVQLSRVSPLSAALQRGEEYSREALQLAPTDEQAQALLLAHLLWRDVQTAGWGQPVPIGPGTATDLAMTVSPDLVAKVLQLGLDANNPAVSIAALKVLGQTGSRGSLLAGGSPLLAALDATEPRLQFAAAEAVLQLDPQQPFAGGRRVVEILARALNSEHQPRSLVIDPNPERGAAIGALISTLGFQTRLATTGQEGFDEAARGGDVELAVLHLNTVRWELTQTLANLRADPRTKGIPIAVYGPSELRGATYPKLKPYRLVSYVDDGSDAGTLRQQLSPLIAARAIPELTEEQRTAQIASAAYWLRHIAEGQRTKVFPLESAETALLRAADQSAVARDVLIALGSMGKPTIQERMAEIALAPGLNVETRRAAIVQLAFHIQKFGRMLTNATAQHVIDAYRQEQTPELREAWAAVVGALRPSLESATPLLLGYPVPAAPLP
jgi:CheY-like chemotaxis protein